MSGPEELARTSAVGRIVTPLLLTGTPRADRLRCDRTPCWILLHALHFAAFLVMETDDGNPTRVWVQVLSGASP